MRISDWSSDVCSSDLQSPGPVRIRSCQPWTRPGSTFRSLHARPSAFQRPIKTHDPRIRPEPVHARHRHHRLRHRRGRSEEHTSELQSLMRISYAVFCLKKKKSYKTHLTRQQPAKAKHEKK